MTDKIPILYLNDGNHVPAFGIEINNQVIRVYDRVLDALHLGIRHIQVMALESLHDVRRAIEDSLVLENLIYISAKVRPGELCDQVEEILYRLQRTHLDLCLLEWPGTRIKPLSAWSAMECIKARGLARSIGVSNMCVRDLDTIVGGAQYYLPAINEREFHPFCNRDNYLPWTKSWGIVTCSFRPCDRFIRESRNYPGYKPKSLSSRDLLRWIQLSGVMVVIPATKRFRLLEQLEMYDTSQTPKEYQAITALGNLTSALGTFQAAKKEEGGSEIVGLELSRALKGNESVTTRLDVVRNLQLFGV